MQPQSDCDLTILDTGAELAKAFKVPLSTAAELLKTRESREAMLFAALSPLAKTTNDVSYLRAHAKDQKPSSQPSSQPSSPPPAQSPSQQQSQPTSLRELAKALASESCVKSVYVPEPWLATPDKTTYRPNKSNTVSVDYATETCTQPLGDKQ